MPEDESYKDESLLNELYVEKGMTQEEIGEKYGVTGVSIGYWIDKYDLIDHNYPWRDEEWLYEQYHEKDKTLAEIADDVDTGIATIHQWLERHNIEINSMSLEESHPVNDPDLLKRLHHDKGKSIRQIANELNTSRSTVKSRLDEYQIDRKYANNEYGSFATGPDGYEYYATGHKKKVRLHRLLVCLKEDPHSVFGESMSTHHKNGVKWDNRVENVELMEKSDHTSLHATKRQQRS